MYGKKYGDETPATSLRVTVAIMMISTGVPFALVRILARYVQLTSSDDSLVFGRGGLARVATNQSAAHRATNPVANIMTKNPAEESMAFAVQAAAMVHNRVVREIQDVLLEKNLPSRS
jgi:hypothetical protein